MFKEITSSKSYRNEYNSFDTSASLSGGFKGFSASASAAYGEVNRLVTSSQEDHYIKKEQKTTYNPLDYQIQREVSTRIQIDGKIAKYLEKRYVDSTSRGQKWNRTQLQTASENYLKNRFYGENDKIRGSTYKIETCVKETCNKKCRDCKKFCQICDDSKNTNGLIELGNSALFSKRTCDRKCSAYARNGSRMAFNPVSALVCPMYYLVLKEKGLTSNQLDDALYKLEGGINFG